MKSINYLLTCMIGIFSLALTSCKKEIAEPAANEPAIMSTTTNGPICGPVRFRKHEWGVFTYTTTIMQKWYTNDRISNITFDFFGGRHSWGLYRGELEHRMPWGEVWYAGNQLYVKEVQKDLIVFRATLDASGKALATYYYNPHDPYNEVFTYDTLYYYYSGDRLDSVIRLNKRRHVMPTIHYSWEKYRFVYDSLGNIAGIHSVNNNSWVSFI
ncbi:MAG TPA: hypothetical protein VD996_14055, partial [Chitinophagaceae bacterium]|nr:hypothetical protein [Chitinophagaceae bacterium]